MKSRGKTLITEALPTPLSSCVFIILFRRQNAFVSQCPKYLNRRISLHATTPIIKEFQGNKKHY